MAALAVTGGLKSAKNVGSASLLYVQSSKYSNLPDKAQNMAAWKRGTGGRSSFNGVVATVFGNTGFLGGYVCGRFGRVGTQLILPYRCDHYDCMKLKVIGDLGQVLFHPFELRDQATIERAVKYSNVVVNVLGRDYETKNFTYEDVHIKGARNIARACKNAGVEKLIHVSYLNSGVDEEPLLLKKPSQWKASKWLGEQAVLEEFPDATIIKASDIYGTNDHFLAPFGSVLRHQGKALPLYAKGEKTFKQPVFAADVAQAIVNAAMDPDSKGKVYQAVGPKRYQLGELVDWFHNIMRKDAEWGYRRYDMKYDPFFQIRVSLIEKFSPAYPFGHLHWEGLERESTTDVVKPDVPGLEDLGVKLTAMENQVPWEMKIFRIHQYYHDDVGEFPTPQDPKTVPLMY